MTRLGLVGMIWSLVCPALTLGQTVVHSGPAGFTQFQVTKQRINLTPPARNPEPVYQAPPVVTTGFTSGGHYQHCHGWGGGYGGYRQFYAGPVYIVPYPWQQTSQPVPYSMPFSIVPDVGPQADMLLKKEKKPSSPAARERSIELQVKADQKIRDQKWSEARAVYSEAVSAAPDRPDAHIGLAISYVTISQFDLAVRELKRALKLDPELALNGKRLEQVFGPNGKIVRNSVITKVSHWVQSDKKSSDRAFLLGAMLYFDGDARAREYLESARKLNTSGATLHIKAFLDANNSKPFPPPEPNPDGLPEPVGVPLNPPAAPNGIPLLNDLPSVPEMVLPKLTDVRFPKSFVPVAASPVPKPMD